MLEFIQKFLYKGFETGDYTNGTLHKLAIAFLITSVILFSYLLRHKDSQYIHNKMKIIAYISLIIYLFRRGLNAYFSGNIFEAYWPFYLCNINTIFLSIYIIFDLNKGKAFFIVTGLIGGLFTFIMPDGIFVDRYLTLGILDSIMSHYAIVVIPLVLLITKAYTLEVKHSWQVFLGLIMVVFNAEVLQRLLFHKNFDYLFFDSNLPFTINGVPQFFIISFLAIILVYLIYFLDYLYLSKTFHHKAPIHSN